MQSRTLTRIFPLMLLLLGSLTVQAQVLGPKSLDELKLLRQGELAQEAASACHTLVSWQQAAHETAAVPHKLLFLRRSLASREYMQRVMLVARHVNGGQDPAWVSPMTSALLGIGDPPDVEGTNKRCSAVAIDAMTPTLPPTPKAKRR